MNLGGTDPFTTPAEWYKSLGPKGKRVVFILLAAIAALAALYIYVFTRPGIELEGKFLASRGDGVYSGKIGGLAVTVNVLNSASPYHLQVKLGHGSQREIFIELSPAAAGDWRQGVTFLVDEEVYFTGLVGDRSAVSALVVFYDQLGQPVVLSEAAYGGSYNGTGDKQDGVPSLGALLRIAEGYAGRQRGDKVIALCGIMLFILPLTELFFGGRLFRWNASFTVSYADIAQPSEWYRLKRGFMLFFMPLASVGLLIAALLI